MSKLSPFEWMAKCGLRISTVREYLPRPAKRDTEPALRLRSGAALTTVRAGEEAIILDKRSGEYFGLNPTAKFLWEGILSGTETNELLERYMSHFGVSHDYASRDYGAFLSAIQGNGIIDRR